MKYQKTLQNTEANGATKNVPDIKFWGNCRRNMNELTTINH